MKVKAAAVQLSPVLYSRERTIRKIVRKIEELGSRKPWCHTTRTFRSSRPPTRSPAGASTSTTFATNRHQGISAIRRGVAHPT